MVTQSKWFERTFDFSFSTGVLPCILERLRGTPARLDEVVKLLPPGILTTRIDYKWSIQEHVGHLVDLDELHEGRVDDFLSGAKVLRAADLENKKTNEANHNANSIQNLLRQFRSGRQRFVGRLEQLDDKQVALVAEHPRLKRPMRVVDMAFFVAEHDDHHLARMNQLARMLQGKD